MAKNNNVKDFAKDIADAIRAKENSVAKINPQDFSARIAALSVGGSPKFAELVDGSITTVEESDLKNVEAIASHTFMFKQNLINVDIPSNVKSIGEKAFMGTSIETLTLAEGVETIGNSAFSITNIRELVLPSSLTSVGEFAFSDIGLLEKVTIKSGITSLPNRLFDGCDDLTEVYMEAITPASIGSDTFPTTTTIYVPYAAYDDYVASWTDYASQIVRLPAIPSTITVIVNDYTGALVSGASVTISGNGQEYTGTTDGVGTFTQGDLQPATYTVSVADMEGFKTPEVSEVVVEEDTRNSVTVTYLEKPAGISGMTAAEIKIIADEISANNMTPSQIENTYGIKAGDTINVARQDGTMIESRILGFNHDTKASGGKAGITFGTTGIVGNSSFHSKSTYTIGWNNCDLRNNYIKNQFNSLTQDWQEIISPVIKKAGHKANGTYGTVVTETTDNLFVLCETEVYGKQINSYNGTEEGTQYEYYKNGGKDTHTTQNWSRSVYKDYQSMIVLFDPARDTSTVQMMGLSSGVSFAFCV